MDAPQLVPLLPTLGPDHALILIQGYMSEHDTVDEEGKWATALREAGWTGAIYHLWWDASSIEGALWSGPLIVNHFGKVKSRAKRVGRDHLLGLLALDVQESSVSLLGFSMGARIVYYGLLEARHHNLDIIDAYLMSGALRRDSSKKWHKAVEGCQGLLINVHNKSDDVLTRLYKPIAWGQNPCGRKPIKYSHPRIVNIDARYVVNSSSHWRCRRYLDELIGVRFVEVCGSLA